MQQEIAQAEPTREHRDLQLLTAGPQRRARPNWHVLVVEKEKREAASLQDSLRRYGHTSQVVHTGSAALTGHYNADIVLLDLDLPDMDGVEVCQDIRSVCNTPVVVVTARDSELDRVLGLQAGADDYLAKPYGFRELLARMEAVMRRAVPAPHDKGVLDLGVLSIHPATRTVKLCGYDIPVTRKEFDLLLLLAKQPGEVVPRRQILRHVWNDPGMGRSRTLDTHINSLRNKLGSPLWITTVRGVGFRLGCT